MAGRRTEVDENQPSWMLEENDEKHREETMPLFGSGKISLQDPEVPAATSYGAVPGDTTTADGSSSNGSNRLHRQDENDAASASSMTSSAGGAATTTTTNGGGSAATAAAAAASTKPHRPGQNCCLWLFHLVEGITVVTALCLMATQVIPLILVIHSSSSSSSTQQQQREGDASNEKDNHFWWARIGLMSLALKAYISFFCLLFVLVELRVPVFFLSAAPLLQTYFSRGLLYSFLGLICVEEAYSERVKDLVAHSREEFRVGWVAIFMQLSSWFMLGCGCLYMLLGLCCLRRLRDRMQREEREVWQKYRKEMKEWKEALQRA